MFKAGDTFYTKTNQKGKVLRVANMNEFGLDFHYEEENYVVEFDNNILPIATYNISDNGVYKYIMNVKEMSLEEPDADKQKTQKKEISDVLFNIMQEGNKQFQKDTGRPMTYLEMRQMYG
jgi:hypothetical protein